MNVTHALQELDDLIVKHTSPPTTPALRNKLHPLREQIEAYITQKEQEAASHTKLVKKHRALERKARALEAQLEKQQAKDSVDDEARCILGALFQEGNGMTVEEITYAVSYEKSAAQYHCEQLGVSGFVERVRFHGDQRRIDGPDWGYGLSQKGRKWILQNPS